MIPDIGQTSHVKSHIAQEHGLILAYARRMPISAEFRSRFVDRKSAKKIDFLTTSNASSDIVSVLIAIDQLGQSRPHTGDTHVEEVQQVRNACRA